LKIDFDALYRRHYGRVFGACLRLLGRRALAEDAAQEVFVRAYRSLDRYDERQPFDRWVLAIASHHCVDLLRRRAREPLRFDDPETAGAASEPPVPATLDVLVDAERDDELRAAIAALPEKYRLPLVLAYYNEASYEEIATTLGITRNHVGVLLLRAKQSLRRALESSGRAPHA